MPASQTPVIDAQVHFYERDRPERPWARPFIGPEEVTAEQMVAAMDAVDVDGAIQVSPFTMYRYDASCTVEGRNRFPGRFAMVKPVDPTDPGVAETIADWARTDGAVGVRLLATHGMPSEPSDPGVRRVLDAAGRYGLAVNLLVWGMLAETAALFAAAPDTQLVVDHLGMKQPYFPPAPPDPFADLPHLLALARHENVAVKITGACTYAHTPFPYPDIWDPLALARHENVAVKITGACTYAHTPFPYPDIWDPLARIFDAFGVERCLWGTDWTRTAPVLTYAEGVEAFRLSDRLSESERAMLMGGAAARVYGWSPG